MTTTRVVNKVLATQEDLLYGEDTAVQSRNGANVTVNKIRSIFPVNSVAERDALDITKFTKCRLYNVDGTELVDYQYISGIWETVSQSNNVKYFALLASAKSAKFLKNQI